MPQFILIRDEKIIVWQRYSQTIEANSLEEAASLLGTIALKDVNPNQIEVLSDTEEIMCVDDNDGYSTVEIFLEPRDTRPLWFNGIDQYPPANES